MKYLAIIIGVALGTIITLLILVGNESLCLQKLDQVSERIEPMTLEMWLGGK